MADKIEHSYLQRLKLLPADTQLLVLAAAAEPLGDPVLLRRAAGVLGIDMTTAVPAADAGLVQVRIRVEFAHPLVRSAAYGAADAADRRRVHHALAEATDALTDPDRRAWHRARATCGPDEEVAAELEQSAGRAQARAGLAAAAAFLTRATELTPLPEARTRRALAAAFANVQAGAFEGTRTLLTIARDGPVDELQRAEIDLVRAQMAFASSRGNEATLLLLAAAQRLRPLNLQLTRQTYLDAFSAAQFAARLDEGVGTAEVARAARAAPRRPDDEPTPGDLLLDAFVALTDDYATAVPLGRDALARLRRGPSSARENLRWLWQGCVLALELWDDESAYDLSGHHLQLARKTGALGELPLALGSRTPILVFRGELAAAAALVEESRSVHEAAGIAEAPYGALILTAWRGQAHEGRELIDVTIGEASARGEGVGVAICEYSHAVLCNGLGQYDEALAAARGACADPREMVAHNWGMTELIESAVRTGRTDLAAEALQRLTTKARACRTDWSLGIEARSQALLSTGDIAERGFREAIGHLSQARVVRAVGVQSEMELAFAGLHLLYAPLLDRLEGRPGPQRDALGIAFGLREGDAPDRFLVGLAVLTLLSEVAEDRPLLCVVDDAQWLDTASAQVLMFAARRLLAEPVGLVFAAREPGKQFRGLADLEVRGLPDQDARMLLRSVVRFRLDERVRDRILAETDGNPLALLELPRGLGPAQLAGGFGLVEAQAIPARIEAGFRRRIEALPADTRALTRIRPGRGGLVPR